MSKLRIILVWIVSLALVVGAYLIYNFYHRTPVIQTSHGLADLGGSDFNTEGGIVMEGLSVGQVEYAEYVELDKDKNVSRKWGFKTLLHDRGGEWEIEKPYMEVYGKDYTINLTADKANVLLEPGMKSPTPRDAKLFGNVIIHIAPKEGGDVPDTFLYFDDITFIATKYLFVTSGPVRFVNEDMDLKGRGLQAVYNEPEGRIEYVRVLFLASLSINRENSKLVGKTDSKKHKASPGVVKAVSKPSNLPEKIKTLPKQHTEGNVDGKSSQLLPIEYKLVFSKNVSIETADQYIFAYDEILINDIVIDNGDDKSSTKMDEADQKAPRKVASAEAKSVAAVKPKSVNKPTKAVENNNQAENRKFDILIQCDNGILFALEDEAREYEKLEAQANTIADRFYKCMNCGPDVPQFLCRSILHELALGDTNALGASELTFFVKASDVEDANLMPVTVACKEKVYFNKDENIVTFTGNCVTSAKKQQGEIQHQHRLSSPQLKVFLTSDSAGLESARLNHITADGGTVQIDTSKRYADKVIGFTKLKCTQFDYDGINENIVATGPGNISIDNSQPSGKSEDKKVAKTSKFSLKSQCYALVEGFETLDYSLRDNVINVVAQDAEWLKIGYIPVENGTHGEPVRMTAKRIKSRFASGEKGSLDISTLDAYDGVTYEDADKQFAGGSMNFDADENVIVAAGGNDYPCVFNGAIVDGIHYDLNTGDLKIEKMLGGQIGSKPQQ
jgi:hypothetical protein